MIEFRLSVTMGCVLCCAALTARSARAEETSVSACVDAHVSGQVARDEGRLLDAKRDFEACAAAACPELVKKDCAQFGAEVETKLPSVIVSAQSTTGQNLTQAYVRVDGRPEQRPLDGRPWSLEPGSHAFEVVTAQGQLATVTVTLRAGEKNRRVVVNVPITTTAAPETSATRVSPLVFVFGGVGLLAAGSFTYFALDGKNTEGCAPNCTDSEVRSMRRSYLIGDISLGVAVASLGLGTYFLLRPPGATSSSNNLAVRIGTSADRSAFRVLASTEF